MLTLSIVPSLTIIPAKQTNNNLPSYPRMEKVITQADWCRQCRITCSTGQCHRSHFLYYLQLGQVSPGDSAIWDMQPASYGWGGRPAPPASGGTGETTGWPCAPWWRSTWRAQGGIKLMTIITWEIVTKMTTCWKQHIDPEDSGGVGRGGGKSTEKALSWVAGQASKIIFWSPSDLNLFPTKHIVEYRRGLFMMISGFIWAPQSCALSCYRHGQL